MIAFTDYIILKLLDIIMLLSYFSPFQTYICSEAVEQKNIDFYFSSFYTAHGVLKAKILKWFAIPFSSGPHFVRIFHHFSFCPVFLHREPKFICDVPLLPISYRNTSSFLFSDTTGNYINFYIIFLNVMLTLSIVQVSISPLGHIIRTDSMFCLNIYSNDIRMVRDGRKHKESRHVNVIKLRKYIIWENIVIENNFNDRNGN